MRVEPAVQVAPPPLHEEPNQFALLGQRRFAPFFWTQFSGAANDNLFKFAFTVMVTYQLSVSWLPPALAGLVIGALFILPFLLFSATSGQLTDKYEKTRVIRFVKNLEILIMAVAVFGFLSGHVNLQVPLLLACTFLMGLHSTLFGPVKFAYLPQALNERELTGGNGMVEMGTFVAILLGNIVGGLLVAVPGNGPVYVALSCVALALAGRVVAQFIPLAPATDPGLRINWNPFTETWRNLKLARENVVVFRSMLGISWMWFFGAVFLSQFPSFAKEVMHGDEQVASLLLVVFSIGIATGSLLCEVLSRRHVEIGLVPLGAIGMSVFAIDLYFSSRGLPPSPLMGLAAFIAQPAHWRVLLDLTLLSLFAGLYSVPMYALIQLRSQPTHRARIIACNNILNALFMIASAILAGALLGAGFSIPQIFLFVGLANAVVAFYIFMLVPEYLLRFIALVASRCIYRFRVTGDDNIPAKGAAVLICNHVSFVDPVLLMAASPRPIYFVMDHRIFKMPVLGWLFRLARAIPIAPRAEDPAAYEAAFEAAAKVLRDGDLLAIFPEGGITKDGTLQEFKGGIMKILENAQRDGLTVPVVPMALSNLWGSFFSRIEQGGAMVRPFRRGLLSRVGLDIGPAVPPEQVQPGVLRERVLALQKSFSSKKNGVLMSKALRLSEKWFQRGLWLVALVFAGFLIGLGGTLVGDLPQVERTLGMDDFIEQPAATQLRDRLKADERNGRDAQEALEQTRLKHRVAQANSRSASETFSNWLATRRATERAEQDPELLERTRALDGLKAAERQALAAMEAQQQKALDASQGAARTRDSLDELERVAQDKWQAAQRAQELRVFLYRLALTLPLLVAAGWLFAKKRKSTYWPFVWGFIFFALFAFFVELVPYLPSYGGYVRYIVGIVITVLVGRQAIVSLNRYLEKQKLAEQLPDAQRREELSYDTALTRLSKGVCPGCERAVDLKNATIDFCPHCGIGLFDHCGVCDARKSAFAKFCHACGTDAKRPKLLPEASAGSDL